MSVHNWVKEEADEDDVPNIVARRRLNDILVQEVSLVDRPANKQPFLVVKNQGEEESMKNIALIQKEDGTWEATGLDTEVDVDAAVATANDVVADETSTETETETVEGSESNTDDTPENTPDDTPDTAKADHPDEPRRSGNGLLMSAASKEALAGALRGTLEQMMILMNAVRSAEETDEKTANLFPAAVGKALGKNIDSLRSVSRSNFTVAKFDLFEEAIAIEELTLSKDTKALFLADAQEAAEGIVEMLNTIKSAENVEADADSFPSPEMAKSIGTILGRLEGILAAYTSPVEKDEAGISPAIKKVVLTKATEALSRLSDFVAAVKVAPEVDETENAILPEAASRELEGISNTLKAIATECPAPTSKNDNPEEDVKFSQIMSEVGRMSSALAGLRLHTEVAEATKTNEGSDNSGTPAETEVISPDTDKRLEAVLATLEKTSESLSSFQGDVETGFKEVAVAIEELSKQVGIVTNRVTSVEKLSGVRKGAGSTEPIDTPTNGATGGIWSDLFKAPAAQAKSRL